MSFQTFAPSPARHSLPRFDELPIQRELPDPLRMLDGSRIDTARDWFERRRPELQRLFEHYVYGYAPAQRIEMECNVAAQGLAMGGKARWKRILMQLTEPSGAPAVELLLLLPAERAPRATFIGINFNGNHTLLEEPVVPEPACPALGTHPRVARGSAASAWEVERVLARGYAIASLHTCDVKPDRDRRDEGIFGCFASEFADDPHAWGTLRVWAWAMSRALDCLERDGDVGGKPCAVLGHSRLGKAALVGAAFDERIALAIIVQAGCGGSAPSRSTVGESVRQINDGFPHWFCDEFKKFGAEPARLPFDQHCLAALVAPRPLLFAAAAEDTWANPSGQLEMLRAAEPVYQLLGAPGLLSPTMPALGELSRGRLGYFIRSGGHAVTPTDWAAFLDYADAHLEPS